MHLNRRRRRHNNDAVFYAAVSNGQNFDDAVPTVCNVGYKYLVGSADLRARIHPPILSALARIIIGYNRNVMGLTKEQTEYFGHLASSRNHSISKEFQVESQRIGFCFDEGTQQLSGQLLVGRIHQLAKDTMKSRADAFIETCRKFNVFPDDKDLQGFVDDTKPYVLNRAQIYEDFCRQPFGPDIPKETSDRILETLKFNLQGIFREGLYPVEQIFLEGRVIESSSPVPTSRVCDEVAILKTHTDPTVQSEGFDEVVFPNDLMHSITASKMHVLEVGDLLDENELDGLITRMYLHSERSFYLYQEKDGVQDLTLSKARDRHDILMDEIEFHYYRHPRYNGHFVRIRPRDVYDFDWEREVVEKGPSYMRIQLRLTERKRRQLEIAENIAAQREADSNPLVLKLSWFGMGIDLPKAWRWVKERLGK